MDIKENPQEWEDKLCTKESFAEADLKRITFRNCRFDGCDFTQAYLNNSKCIDCTWIRCNMSLVRWDGCRLQGARFEECKIVGANFSKCDPLFFAVGFKKCLLETCNFSDIDLKGTSFAGSTLRETHFSQVKLAHADFHDCTFKGGLFHHTDLTGANFLNASNFSIDPTTNILKKARFSKEEAIALLSYLGILLE